MALLKLLKREISPQGEIVLFIKCPDPEQQKSEAIARIYIHNGSALNKEDDFSIGGIEFTTSDLEKSYVVGWRYDVDLRDGLLFEWHVEALVRFLQSLLILEMPDNEEEEEKEEEYGWPRTSEQEGKLHARWGREHAKYKEWYYHVVAPAMTKAEEMLSPLFSIALPDPQSEDVIPMDRNDPYWAYWSVGAAEELYRKALKRHPNNLLDIYVS